MSPTSHTDKLPVMLKFPAIPKSGNAYKIGSRGQAKALTEYHKQWQLLCQVAHNKAGRPLIRVPVICTPVCVRWHKRYWYDDQDLWWGLKPIIDNLTMPKKKNRRGQMTFGLGMLEDDKHNQFKTGVPVWIKPSQKENDRMILFFDRISIQDHQGLWPEEYFNKVWNNNKGQER